MLWLAVLFVLPFYVILSVALGTVHPIFRSPLPVWQPWYWSTEHVRDAEKTGIKIARLSG